MGTFKKCVMCLALLLAGLTLLAAGLAISPRSGLAQAEPAADDFPEVFGVKLGDDILDYLGMEPSRPSVDGSTIYRRQSDRYRTFAGIPVTYPEYSVYENRISSIHFCIAPDNVEKIVAYFVSTYGEFRRDEDGYYFWGNSYFGIEVGPTVSENECRVVFRHLPLIETYKSAHLGLNDPLAKYKGKGVPPYLFLSPEQNFALGRMDYQSVTWRYEPDSVVVYETRTGIIYQRRIFFDLEGFGTALAALREKYKQWDSEFEPDDEDDGNIYCWNLGEYKITLGQLEKEPGKGLLIFEYRPLWREASAAEGEYERLNESIFVLDSHGTPERTVTSGAGGK